MVSWRVDEFTLTTFHLRRSFLADLLHNMAPWMRRIRDVRLAMLHNAIDSSRKDQWFWMQKYEAFIVEHEGEKARFLPREEKRDGKRAAKRDADPGEPGAAVVEFEP